MRNNIWTILTAAVVAAVLALVMFTFTVEEGTQAVVYTFGAIREDGVKREPGLYFRWPAGIQRVVPVDTRARVLNIKGNEPVTTSDQNQIYLSVTLDWRIKDSEIFIKRMTNDQGLSIEEKAAQYLQDRVRDARQRVVNQFALNSFIAPAATQPKAYADLEQAILALVDREVTRSDYGVEIRGLEITRISFPKNTSKDIFESMIIERTQRSEKNITDGKEEAKQIVNQASLEKQKLISQAMADARRIRGEGDAAAAEFYKEFRKNPQLANFLRRLDTLEEILKNKATVALPGKNPLDGLIENPPVVPTK